MMKKIPFPGLIALLILLGVLGSSCASNKPPYRHQKPKRPSKCDCSRWSELKPESIIHLKDNEEGPATRA
jgi:hypothetical protein